MRAARDAGMLDDGETERALAMVDDRNLTVHTYNEELAQAIYARLGGPGAATQPMPRVRGSPGRPPSARPHGR